MSSSKTTRSFKIPAELEVKMNQKLVSEGYGLRGKSKWICDAIKKFLTYADNDFILDCIEYADEFENLDKSVSFRPTDEVDILINDWVVLARKNMPALEGVRSKIIRTAILQAILGSIDSLTKIDTTLKTPPGGVFLTN